MINIRKYGDKVVNVGGVTTKAVYVLKPKEEELKKIIKERGMTLEGLSHDMGITMMSLHNKIKGKRNFTTFEVLLLSDIINLTGKEMLDIFFYRKG